MPCIKVDRILTSKIKEFQDLTVGDIFRATKAPGAVYMKAGLPVPFNAVNTHGVVTVFEYTDQVIELEGTLTVKDV